MRRGAASPPAEIAGNCSARSCWLVPTIVGSCRLRSCWLARSGRRWPRVRARALRMNCPNGSRISVRRRSWHQLSSSARRSAHSRPQWASSAHFRACCSSAPISISSASSGSRHEKPCTSGSQVRTGAWTRRISATSCSGSPTASATAASWAPSATSRRTTGALSRQASGQRTPERWPCLRSHCSRAPRMQGTAYVLSL